MNLEEFLAKMQIPRYEEIYSGNANGVVKLEHPEVEVRTEEGLEKRTKSDFHTEYILFLGIIGDKSYLTFAWLYQTAVHKYGFPKHAPTAGMHLGMLKFFEKIGAVRAIEGDENRHFGLDYPWLSKIEVLSAEPKDPSKEQAFRKYFPKA